MARVGIVFGLLLCVLTFLGLVGTEIKSPTQFYPMMLGIPILFCGVVALNPHRRKHAMHVISAIALLATIAGGTSSAFSLARLARNGEVDRYGLALTAVMTVLCLLLLGVCITSFILARRRRMALDEDQSVNLHPPSSSQPAATGTSSRETA